MRESQHPTTVCLQTPVLPCCFATTVKNKQSKSYQSHADMNQNHVARCMDEYFNIQTNMGMEASSRNT